MEASQLETTMDSISSLPPLTKTWLLDGPLSPHVEAYTANLERGSYSQQTSRSGVGVDGHDHMDIKREMLAKLHQILDQNFV
jgi:hypothetical protein